MQKTTVVDSPKLEKFSFLNALRLNASIHKDLELAEALFKTDKFKEATSDFLALFSAEDLIKKAVKNKDSFIANIEVYNLDPALLPDKWDAEFTKIAITQCVNDIKNNRHNLKKALWKMAPYFSGNAENAFNSAHNSSNYSGSFRAEFDEILQIKKTFDTITY